VCLRKDKQVKVDFPTLQICENVNGIEINCSSALAQHVTSHITSHCWLFSIRSVYSSFSCFFMKDCKTISHMLYRNRLGVLHSKKPNVTKLIISRPIAEDHHRIIAAALRPPADWRRPTGRPRTTWLRTVDEEAQP